MIFDKPLLHGILINRHKRFLAEVELDNGNIVWAHCTNSGSMKSCLEAGAEVYISPVDDPNRKTQFTWEMIKINNNWVGINTAWPNKIAFEAIKNNQVQKLSGYTFVKREVKFGDSRFDIYCENENEKCFVEVKNVSYKKGDFALFPDAITVRGQKHLKTLIEVKKQGIRAIMLYIIQRTDVQIFGPAIDVDPEYAKILSEAYNSGVEIIAIQAEVDPFGIKLGLELPLKLNI